MDGTRDTGWFTSSRSGATNNDCVEVRLTDAGTRVRDSKDRHGPALAFSPAAWSALLGTTRTAQQH
ncbi:DUF397 domain-containing protein [Amycolatopsis antarctica]|uniref:DUF397 domain-containing protein n=1 Tax=Amycolatopsis antarctica TaxID=1854586 RepID=A0A263D437_9PSEU|nr:DUF397 domain-containing protein [Amycolatopsis antarctica]OZM72387.1 DUF397 domain-containing protein [Amycolatopsis antarctica]